MPVSIRQKKLKKKMKLFGLLSSLLWIGTAITLAILVFTKVGGSNSNGNSDALITISAGAKDRLVAMSVTICVGLIVGIVIKEKIRTAIWMICTVIATIMYKEAGMYIVLGMWLIDEYVINALFRYYKSKYIIRKEIDQE